ncbi:transposable element Tcb2 transposase [Trichonephila clavipes]|nr:transposable element Tcb2 transposase [Trichonephila clavipes]
MTVKWYVHDIMQPCVAIHATAPRSYFSTRPFMGWRSQEYIHTVTTLPWPARFPDLFPVEHIWDHLGWRVGHPTSLNELEASAHSTQCSSKTIPCRKSHGESEQSDWIWHPSLDGKLPRSESR